MLCSGSPLFLVFVFSDFWFVVFFMSGRLQGRGVNYTLVLPSLICLVLFFLVMLFTCRGDSQGGDRIIYTLVLPSLNRFLSGFILFKFRCRGDSQGVFLFNSRSPPVFLAIVHFDHFEHFN